MDPNTYPLLDKLAASGIVGRGGAAFPTHLKWKRLKTLGTAVGYVVCNASEGEPDVRKDAYLLEHHPDTVIKGMVTAMEFFETHEAYININKNYYETYGPGLHVITDPLAHEKNLIFHYYVEDPSYIGGETGALLNAIEGKRTQPRPANPSPSLKGINNKPVLVNNVETYYDVARVVDGTFEPTRFITVVGPVPHPGVFSVDRGLTVEQALVSTENTIEGDYFVQVGGGASGEIITKDQAKTHSITGCGTIEIFTSDTHMYSLLMKWFDFYFHQSCGKCTPCREGTYRLYSQLKASGPSGPIPWDEIRSIMMTMKTTSFCDLGKSLPIPVESYMKNILGIHLEVTCTSP